MKKVKRMLAMCLASAMILSAMVLPASAESLGVSLRSSYNKTPVSTCNVKYDIGSIMPYDDVRAATRVKLESSSGYAKVSLVGKTVVEQVRAIITQTALVGWIRYGRLLKVLIMPLR